MKKHISILSALLACCLLAGCGDNTETSSEVLPESSALTAESGLPEESSLGDVSSTDSSDGESSGEASKDMSGENSEEESSDDVSANSSDISAEESLPAESSAPAEESSEHTYANVDFKSLQRINKDIYAWIRIPGTVIDYPILNRKGDNAFYLKRNYYGYADSRGSIYTEDYNSRDFNDPVTLIYGHNMSSGSMFGSIQKTYTRRSFMESHKEIQIIMPDKTYTYEIFAAVPYSNIHLMYYYDFTKPIVFDQVMDDILSVRAVNAVIDRTVNVTSNDHIIILSTCLTGNDNKRYLLLAVRK